MTMSTFENAPPLDGWRDPRTDPAPVRPPRCCGLFCTSYACSVCGNYVAMPSVGCE